MSSNVDLRVVQPTTVFIASGLNSQEKKDKVISEPKTVKILSTITSADEEFLKTHTGMSNEPLSIDSVVKEKKEVKSRNKMRVTRSSSAFGSK